ncbi:MAG: hypothetical protein R3343_04625 [Nitriliruptorales bacterium]|nr:hypothetical protein [Nitriliruptorales bacterium]
MPLPLAHGAPAGGAALREVLIATGVGAAALVAFAVFAWAHRTGRIRWYRDIERFSERVSGLPAWAAIPLTVAGVSLIIAVFGYYWDVSTHIDNGRDAGPFANPSHYFILVGLVGIALAGGLSIVSGSERTRSSVRLREGWHAPIGGVLLALCGVVALAGFPLDDLWHRLFGQDVTLWGPTHIQMIGGASLATLALWVLSVEARRIGNPRAWTRRFADVALAGGFLLGLSTLQGEFDFGVPQFRLLYHPVLVMFAAGLGLVTARIRIGRGGALYAVAFFLAIRGALTLGIGVGLERVTLHFPLYLAEAALVELVALRVRPHRQLTFGATAGAAIGTVGLAAEWLWSHLWMPLPWNAALVPEVLVVAPLAAVTGGMLGGFAGRALQPVGAPRQSARSWVAVVVGGGALLALFWPLPMQPPPDDLAVRMDLEPATAGGGEAVTATLTLSPRDAADDRPDWLTVTAWQGAEWQDRQSIVDHLERVERGVYRTTQPIPTHGDWKALVRFHDGRIMAAAPLFLPADAVIDAEEVPATDGATRDFVYGKTLLQREAKDVPQSLWNVGYAVLAVVIGAWIGAVAWGLRRLRHTRPEDGTPHQATDRQHADVP